MPEKVKWRFIPLLNAPARVQMALDAWLFTQHHGGLHPPTLRFYTWSPIAISLGYHQKQVPEAWHRLTWQGQPIDLVRRPSGGRAVLHQGDLTYAVVTSGVVMPNLSGNRMAAYQQICQFLIDGWRSLQVDLHYGLAGRGYRQNPNCFATATIADLVTANGNKLIGSAQLRQGNAILQHGSMRLEPDRDLFKSVFGTELESELVSLPGLDTQSNGKIIEQLTIKVKEQSKEQLGDQFIQLLIETLKQSASVSFNAEFVTQPLSESEWHSLKEIAHTLDNL